MLLLLRLQEVAGFSLLVLVLLRLQEVAGFEVSVDHVEGVNKLQAPQYLVHEVLEVVCRQGLGADYDLRMGMNGG